MKQGAVKHGELMQMTTRDAGTAPAPEQRSEPPKTDATSSAPGTPAAPAAPPHAAQKPATFVPSVIVGLIIAAVAGANDCVVVTENERDFAGLEIVNPMRA